QRGCDARADADAGRVVRNDRLSRLRGAGRVDRRQRHPAQAARDYVTGAVTSPLQRLARALLDLAFRFRVPLTWVVAIGGLLLARPTTASIVVGAAWALIGLGWRAWAAGTIRKNAELAADGPYALSRHPLYFGNFMLA